MTRTRTRTRTGGGSAVSFGSERNSDSTTRVDRWVLGSVSGRVRARAIAARKRARATGGATKARDRSRRRDLFPTRAGSPRYARASRRRATISSSPRGPGGGGRPKLDATPGRNRRASSPRDRSRRRAIASARSRRRSGRVARCRDARARDATPRARLPGVAPRTRSAPSDDDERRAREPSRATGRLIADGRRERAPWRTSPSRSGARGRP